jgi:hypothetical protein
MKDQWPSRTKSFLCGLWMGCSFIVLITATALAQPRGAAEGLPPDERPGTTSEAERARIQAERERAAETRGMEAERARVATAMSIVQKCMSQASAATPSVTTSMTLKVQGRSPTPLLVRLT